MAKKKSGQDPHADELEQQLEFMRRKLKDTRGQIEKLPLYYIATNSNGERVPKKNPAFDEYAQLMRCYCSTLDVWRELVAAKPQAQPALVKFDNFAKTMRKSADA